jgi:hypothetical protein
MNKLFCKIGVSLVGGPAVLNGLLILSDVKAPKLMPFLMEVCFLGLAIAIGCGTKEVVTNQAAILAAAQGK